VISIRMSRIVEDCATSKSIRNVLVPILFDELGVISPGYTVGLVLDTIGCPVRLVSIMTHDW
jgi:hypothetical protein